MGIATLSLLILMSDENLIFIINITQVYSVYKIKTDNLQWHGPYLVETVAQRKHVHNENNNKKHNRLIAGLYNERQSTCTCT